MEIKVDCYAGYRGEETPRRLTMGTRLISVVAVQDQWLAPDHRYFKIIGDDGGLYIIRHNPQQDTWQLTCFKHRRHLERPCFVVDASTNPRLC